jgi:riboflavin kinase/FMN adenylyltransferase
MMERYLGLDAALSRSAQAGSTPTRVATIGFFDGVHIGHRGLLDELKDWARELEVEPAVVTFNCHPQSVLGDHPPTPVVSLEHRLLLLEREGVAATLVLEFDDALRSWSPEEFIDKVFRQALGTSAILMGFDSAFGFRRQGTFEYLLAKQDELGVEVRQCGARLLGDERVSSTLVREAIARWDLERLEGLLGRRFSLLGRVVPGDGRGRTIGFPTANLDLGLASVPPVGVYFAEVRRLGRGDSSAASSDSDLLPALVNIGRRPTFTSQQEAAQGEAFDSARDVVEVHLLDFDADLYGEMLEVVILDRHRDERKFAGVDELVAQIGKDVDARRRLSTGERLSGGA